MKNIQEITNATDYIFRLTEFNKGYWSRHFKDEPDYLKILDAYRTVVVSSRAYKTTMEVAADASENMCTDLVAVYNEAASKTLVRMTDAAAYLVAKVGTNGNESKAKIQQAKYMYKDAVAVYNAVSELAEAE